MHADDKIASSPLSEPNLHISVLVTCTLSTVRDDTIDERRDAHGDIDSFFDCLDSGLEIREIA